GRQTCRPLAGPSSRPICHDSGQGPTTPQPSRCGGGVSARAVLGRRSPPVRLPTAGRSPAPVPLMRDALTRSAQSRAAALLVPASDGFRPPPRVIGVNAVRVRKDASGPIATHGGAAQAQRSRDVLGVPPPVASTEVVLPPRTDLAAAPVLSGTSRGKFCPARRLPKLVPASPRVSLDVSLGPSIWPRRRPVQCPGSPHGRIPQDPICRIPADGSGKF